MEEMCPFAKPLNGMMKQQIVAAVAENVCLHRYVILLKSPKSCLKTYCF